MHSSFDFCIPKLCWQILEAIAAIVEQFVAFVAQFLLTFFLFVHWWSAIKCNSQGFLTALRTVKMRTTSEPKKFVASIVANIVDLLQKDKKEKEHSVATGNVATMHFTPTSHNHME